MNWDLVCSLLENYTIIKKANKNFAASDYVLFLTEAAQDSPNYVYVDAGDGKGRELSHALVISVKKRPAKCANYIVVAEGTPQEILNALLTAKAHLELLAGRLSLAETNQEIVETAYDMLGMPMFYFDSSYRVLAMTYDADIQGDAEWDHMKARGFLSADSAKHMRDAGDLDLLADQTEPFHYNAEFYPFESLVCNVWLEKEFYGRLNVLFLASTPTQLNIEECRIICKYLKRLAHADQSRIPYTGPLDNMIMDLLKGQSLSEELMYDRLSHKPELLSSICQICCIDPEMKGDKQVLHYFSSVLENAFSGEEVITQEFENRIVLVLHGRSREDFARYYKKIDALLIGQNLSGATSNYFRKFNTLRDYYLQARTILELRRDVGLMHFPDTYFDYVLSFIPQDHALALISDRLDRLKEAEAEYKFPLLETLRIYLETGCNLQLTAEKLFVHKNTALYRINLLRDLLGDDLNDVGIRMQLLFSFRIAEKYRG